MFLPPGSRVLVTGGSGFIGTNLVDTLHSQGVGVRNADLMPPLRPGAARHWTRCDVTEPGPLRELLTGYDPHYVVHLAARTDTDSDDERDYAVNHVGTEQVLACRPPALRRVAVVSTQFVLGPGVGFQAEDQYAPHTAYGHSKVRAEQVTRASEGVEWVILRPTNVWGPWHLRYQREFWRVLSRGLYLHPGSPDPIRSYGYVGSVCLQILQALGARPAAGRTLYVGDPPIHLSRYVDAFAVALRGRPARRVPGRVLAGLARGGDALRRLGLPALLTSGRLRSMTEDYPTPIQRTADLLGGLPVVPLEQGVAETAAWLADGTPPDPLGWLGSAGDHDPRER